PNHLKRDFLFPDVKVEEDNKKILSKSTVRVIGSFDMGWPTKGSGRCYDSLPGTAGLIGYFSNKILSQVVLNRKCRKCDLGCSKDKHDCRLNFEGSAKAMEPKAAALLVGDNDILSKCNVQLAQKASGFSAGVSCNPNESFNAMGASKSPKSKMVDESSKRKYRKSIKPAFKRRRLFLKKRKSELRHKNELSEGTTYQPNVTLLDSTFDDIEMASVDENLPPIVVFFDLETGDLCRDGDILQIAVKYKEYTFSVYIRPSRTISDKASQVHGLTFVNGQLELHGKTVITVALQEAVVSLYRFLFLFNRKCILTAHNCTFDYTRLMRDIEKTFMDIYFKTIVSGFADTLPLIRAATGLNKAGDNKLENLGKRLGIQGFQAHDALGDVYIRKSRVEISYKMIIDIYKQEGEDGITRLFGADENGKVRVTKSIRVITKLCDFLRTKYEFVAYI
ncbi:hypothetical protein PV326_009843, partial [Microctonus aethiopoides]